MGDSRKPLLVGAAQLIQRDVELDEALEPLEMLTRVARGAVADADLVPDIASKIDGIGLVDVLGWAPRNGPRLVGDSLGCGGLSAEIHCPVGGETPVKIINHFAGRIAAGDSQITLIAGCNDFRTLKRAHKAGAKLDWRSGGAGAPQLLVADEPGTNEVEQRYGLVLPPQIYPIFENALRFERGLDLEAHRRAMGDLFSAFSRVAATNPYAWFPVEHSSDALIEVRESNRRVAFPYTKLLNAFLETDQAAAVLMMSEETARSLGVPEEKWVYWRGGADAVEEAWWASERPRFAESPAMRACHLASLERSEVALDDVACFDFYSCFPSAVSMACRMLGVAEDDPRPFTVTGGLPYMGGPGNAYSIHAVAAMIERMRRDVGSIGMVTGNGWYLTKHAAVVLSTTPGPIASEWGRARPDPGTAHGYATETAPVPVLERAEGPARVLTYTVLFDRDGAPYRGIVIGELAEGGRFLANTPPDRTLLEDWITREWVGERGAVSHVADVNRFDFR